MQKKIGLLFAGQGAQQVGMGRDIVAEFPEAADLFERADQILGRNLSAIAWQGPLQELTRTSNCQPALYIYGLACLSALREITHTFHVTAAAGLSLGEWTAHAAAGTFSFEDALRLVEQRGRFMEAACEKTSGAMAAMIGGDEASARALAQATDVDVANLNAPGQIVLSGERAHIERAVARAKEFGIRRATLLNVAGAYHSHLMAEARREVGASLQNVALKKPQFPVVSNVTGEVVARADEIRRTLEEQVTATVRWMACLEKMFALGCDFFLELGPGGVLAGLLQRTRKDAEIISVGDVASLQKAAEMIRGS